jgi:hypothetical protein
MSSQPEAALDSQTLQGDAADSDHRGGHHQQVLLVQLDQHSRAICLA